LYDPSYFVKIILQVHKFSSITIYRNGRLEIHIDFSTFVWM